MEDITPEQRSNLGRIAGDAGHVEDLLKHPGMAVVRAAIENQLEFKQKKWYEATSPEEAEKIRLKARGYEDFFRICKVIIANGEAARKQLQPPSEA